MNTKAFYERHHRFPYSQEFHIIKEAMQQQARDHPEQLTPQQLQDPVECFVMAAKLNQLDDMKEIFALGVDIDAHNQAGMTALCAAAQWNNINCVEYLLDNGASIDLRSSSARSPLLYAAESGNLHLMSYLINRGSTNFTYNDQQLESYFISYTIRQAITRRDVSHVIQDDRITDLVLDFLGLSASRNRPLDRMTAAVDTMYVNKYIPNPYRRGLLVPNSTRVSTNPAADAAAAAAASSAKAAASQSTMTQEEGEY